MCVRSQPVAGQEANPAYVNQGLTAGAYQMQTALYQVDESRVRRFATRTCVIPPMPLRSLGCLAHSPLLGEAGESSADNNTFAGA